MEPRKRYRTYANPENSSQDVPRNTSRRYETEPQYEPNNIRIAAAGCPRVDEMREDNEEADYNIENNVRIAAESSPVNEMREDNEEVDHNIEITSESGLPVCARSQDESMPPRNAMGSASSRDSDTSEPQIDNICTSPCDDQESNTSFEVSEGFMCGREKGKDKERVDQRPDGSKRQRSQHEIANYVACERSGGGDKNTSTYTALSSTASKENEHAVSPSHESNDDHENSSDDSGDDEHGHPIDDDEYDDLEEESEHESDEDSSEEQHEPQQVPQPEQLPLPPPPPEHDYLLSKLQGPFAERIEDRVAASRGEILLNLQEFCNRHPIPLTAQEDLHQLINSLFYKEVIPESKFKIDKLYARTNNVKYNFYCCKCFYSFGELDYKAIKVKECPECGTVNPVGDMTKAKYFVTIDFTKQLQLLLDNPDIASQLKQPNEFPDNGDVMKDLYDGLMYKQFVSSLDFTVPCKYISLTVCTDGTPLFKSSTLSIWPIFVIVNELPYKIRTSNILLGGLWIGTTHPVMDLFLEAFCNFVRTLSCAGFYLNVSGELQLFKAYMLAWCVDSGARGSVQCIHCHNGENSCNWCLHPGVVEGNGSNARKFPQLIQDPPERTAQQMLEDGATVIALAGNKNHVNGVLGLSPLLRCPKFNIVHGMVLDNLHWASFGVARRLCHLWLGESKKKKKKKEVPAVPAMPMPAYYVGTDETKSVINKRILQLRPPIEVRRRPRDLSQLHSYNAREYENFILFFSVPIFQGILPQRFMKHWILFVQAYYLLMKCNLKKGEIKVSGYFFKRYVDKIEELYGLTEMTFNNHLSTHAAENALRWGNGYSISTYAFENGNKVLKSKVNAERGICHQIIRSLDRDSSLLVLRRMACTPQSDSLRRNMERKEVKKCFYAGSIQCIMPEPFSPSAEESWLCERKGLTCTSFTQCRRIIQEHICYSVDNGKSRTNNSFAFCANESIFKIRKIIASEISGEVYVFASKVRCVPFEVPRCELQETFSPFMYRIQLVEEGVIILPSLDLKTICVSCNVDCQFFKGHLISVMPNTSNVF